MAKDPYQRNEAVNLSIFYKFTVSNLKYIANYTILVLFTCIIFYWIKFSRNFHMENYVLVDVGEWNDFSVSFWKKITKEI